MKREVGNLEDLQEIIFYIILKYIFLILPHTIFESKHLEKLKKRLDMANDNQWVT